MKVQILELLAGQHSEPNGKPLDFANVEAAQQYVEKLEAVYKGRYFGFETLEDKAPRYANFNDLEVLNAKVRLTLFRIAVGTIEVPEDVNARQELTLPLEWFVERYAAAKYKELFYVWTSGLDGMLSKTLVERCYELLELSSFKES